MFEVTREKLEKAIEEEKECVKRYEKKLTRFIIFFAILNLIELMLLISLPIEKSFLALIAVIAFDLVLLIMCISFFTWQQSGVFSPWLVINSTSEVKFSQKLKTLDDVSKIQLLEQKAKTTKGILRTNTLASLIPLYSRMDEPAKLKALADYMMNTKPKRKFERILRMDALLAYYDYMDDAENYTKLFEENLQEITDLWENERINYKNLAIGRLISYLFYTNEYKEAFRLHNLLLEFLDKFAEVMPSFTPEQINWSRNVNCLDYAMYYCKMGEKEKAAESFRVALERFENTDVPFLKKQLEKVRRMLDEAGIDYT